MIEKLDTIPIIFFRRDRRKEVDWEKSPTHPLLDAEYVDTDLVNLIIFGDHKDYQIQFKLSAFIRMLKARGIPLHDTEIEA